MRARTAVAATGVLLLALCSSAARPSTGSASGRMSPEARSYLSEALSLVQRHALNAAKVDWPTVRGQAFAQAAAARTPADTYAAIRTAVAALGDRHSRFYPAGQAAGLTADPATVDAPTIARLPGGIAHLTLPPVNGSERTYAEYVARGRTAVSGTEACGWVVDLRRETGGGMWAPLAVAAPLLGDGPLGAFVTADGTRSTWSIRGGVPYLEDAPQAAPDTTGRTAAAPPIAVLTGPATGSAGEAVTIALIGHPDTRSFGAPTYGVPTGNEPHRLSDGAVLLLAGAAEADRTGRVHEGPIEPDEFVDPRKDDDPTLAAAVAWLSQRAACSKGRGLPGEP
ncbi:S41 family peptidase [Kitasatospora sp. NPDC101157]|uniref:S41 family peptidase n=1 Tax=Kitasatospora sp. NPDC101157 TaxID=3364098 RepID=UPI00382000F3